MSNKISDSKTADVLIVGAGFSGLYLLWLLRKREALADWYRKKPARPRRGQRPGRA